MNPQMPMPGQTQAGKEAHCHDRNANKNVHFISMIEKGKAWPEKLGAWPQISLL